MDQKFVRLISLIEIDIQFLLPWRTSLISLIEMDVQFLLPRKASETMSAPVDSALNVYCSAVRWTHYIWAQCNTLKYPHPVILSGRQVMSDIQFAPNTITGALLGIILGYKHGHSVTWHTDLYTLPKKSFNWYGESRSNDMCRKTHIEWISTSTESRKC